MKTTGNRFEPIFSDGRDLTSEQIEEDIDAFNAWCEEHPEEFKRAARPSAVLDPTPYPDELVRDAVRAGQLVPLVTGGATPVRLDVVDGLRARMGLRDRRARESAR